MNVYLGIDWSQMKHDLCWMNEAGGRGRVQVALGTIQLH